MINYDTFGRPPRRGSGHAVLTALVAALALGGGLAVLVMGHVVTIGRAARSPIAASVSASRSPVAVTAALPQVTRPAGTLTLGACIDPTSSIVSSFASAIRGDLAQAVGSLAPLSGKLPTNTISGGPVTQPQAGVKLTVRQVTTNSYSSNPGPYTRSVAVPPVPGLAHPRPEPGAQDYLSQLRTWTAGYEGVAAARAEARRDAAAGESTIASMPLDRRGWSGVSACISGLLTTMPPGGTHSYLLASDLQENVTPQLAGSFHGASLVIIQTCDTGNAAYCQHLLERFTRTMRRLDVGPITIVRPEVAAAAIAQWIRTGEVAP
jgi:hypothetical protein